MPYIRYVVPHIAECAKVHRGIFASAYEVRDDPKVPNWLQKEMANEIRWFSEYLLVPSQFGIRTRKSNRSYGGVCWFHDNAHNAISHARNIVALLWECGVSVRQIRTDRPGFVVYKDEQQIVAIPGMR